MQKIKTALQNNTVRGALFGFLAGLVLLIVSARFEMIRNQQPMSIAAFLQMQGNQPWLWLMADLAPIVLWVLGWLLAQRQSAVEAIDEQVEGKVAEQMARLMADNLALQQKIEERDQLHISVGAIGSKEA